MNRYSESERMFQQALELIPNGATKARVPQSFVDGPWPVYVSKTEGPYFWDVDGNRFTDYLCAFGPIILGYNHPRVDQAVIEQIKKGFICSLSSPLQNELAEKLIDLIPSAEMASFLKTGSAACSLAVRFARAYTGRDHIIRWGYHGWHDWCLGSKGVGDLPMGMDKYADRTKLDAYGDWIGVPQAIRDLTHAFEYNNLASLEALLDEYVGNVACIIMMPFEVEFPQPGFLEGVRELADKHDVVLIFDEIRSWPWMGLGGAQERFGVLPDLTCLSKAIANGYPLAAVVGKKEIMKTDIFLSGTFLVNSLEMAAALATIDELETEDAISTIWKRGERFCAGLQDAISDRGIHGRVAGPPCQPFLAFAAEEGARNEPIKREFYVEAAMRGVFLHPNHHWFINMAHTDAVIEESLVAIGAALDAALEKASQGE